MINVLLVNNYSMEKAYDLWDRGISGSHHVWGKVELDQSSDINMIIFPHERHRWINNIGKFFGIKHLDQQLRMLFCLDSFDILYAPYSLSNLKLILILKSLGIFKKPIVVTIHQPIIIAHQKRSIVKAVSKWILKQYDYSIFLSKPLMDKLIANLNIKEEIYKNRFTTTQWGPDFSYYEKYCLTRIPFNECEYFISAGHTDRDFELLIEAFKGLPYKLKIFCTPDSIPRFTEIPPNVELNWEITFSKDLIPFYQKSIAILIPLIYRAEKEGCQGMTSIQDVLTFGKPTIITNNPCLNIDVEEEGNGFKVDMHDVEGWRDKLEILATDCEIWENMSLSSTQLFKNKVNSVIFADHLSEVFTGVYNDCLLESKIQQA